MIEAPEDLQEDLQIPEDHLKVCQDAGVPTQGNAAGNTKDFLDLTGEAKPPPELPAGFVCPPSHYLLKKTKLITPPLKGSHQEA